MSNIRIKFLNWVALYWTRMHSSRMRTGRTLTVFRKLETPPKIWSRHPPRTRHPPLENLEQTPPLENLEQTPLLGPDPPGTRHPPKTIWSRHPTPPPKFGADTPPGDQTPPQKNLEQTPHPQNLEQTLPPPGPDTTPPLWTEWMTDRCKNITLAKTSFRPVIRRNRGPKTYPRRYRVRASSRCWQVMSALISVSPLLVRLNVT